MPASCRSGWPRGRWWWRRSSRTPTPTRARCGGAARAGLRAEADLRNEKINYKVREHSLGKVPLLLALGRKEVEDGTVSLRRLGEQGQEVLPLAQAIDLIAGEATPPDLAG
jgi:threonyl-tRNA synthetase